MIEVKNITKKYGSFTAVDNISFKIEEGEIIGLLGPNGAGKTSLFTAIKVALYGPLAYGYVAVNSHYIAKIKGLINLLIYMYKLF